MKYAIQSTLWAKKRKECAARQEPCERCGEPIDYELQPPDPRSWSGQHLISMTDKLNVNILFSNPIVSAHLACTPVRKELA